MTNISFAEWSYNNITGNVNFSSIGRLKKLVKQPDTYEKLRLLGKELNEFSGNKSNLIYKLAVYEFNKLKKQEKRLLREKKQRIREKYTNDSDIQAEKVSLSLTLHDLDILTKELYASYINTKEFKKLCKAMRDYILPPFLSNFKADNNKKMYAKYYSVYIDVREFLENNY